MKALGLPVKFCASLVLVRGVRPRVELPAHPRLPLHGAEAHEEAASLPGLPGPGAGPGGRGSPSRPGPNPKKGGTYFIMKDMYRSSCLYLSSKKTKRPWLAGCQAQAQAESNDPVVGLFFLTETHPVPSGK